MQEPKLNEYTIVLAPSSMEVSCKFKLDIVLANLIKTYVF